MIPENQIIIIAKQMTQYLAIQKQDYIINYKQNIQTQQEDFFPDEMLYVDIYDEQNITDYDNYANNYEPFDQEEDEYYYYNNDIEKQGENFFQNLNNAQDEDWLTEDEDNQDF